LIAEQQSMLFEALSRRAVLATLALSVSAPVSAPPETPFAETPFGSVYTGVRKAVVRSAQIADGLDRWQKGLYEDLTIGEPAPPDNSPLATDPALAKTVLDAAADAFATVRPGVRIEALQRRADAAALKLLTNSERQAVERDTGCTGAAFNFALLCAWLGYLEALPDGASQRRFNALFGERLLRDVRPATTRAACSSGAGSLEAALRESRQLVEAFERGGAVRGVKWQGLDLVTDDVTDSFSVLLERSAWLDTSLRLQQGNSRFFPDPIGAIVAASLERCAGIRTSRIEYYLDDTYRPKSSNPQPTQTLIEFSLLR
jgi:hypothetical protein